MARSVSQTSRDAPSHIHHLVWLDEELDNDKYDEKIHRLQELDEKMGTFTSRKQCLAYLDNLNERNTKSYVIFIVSGALSEKIIPKIEDHLCILAIFIFCDESERNNELESNMISVCTDIDLLIHRILGCISRDNLSMDFKLMSTPNSNETETTEEQRPIGHFKEDEAYFLWFYKCHSFMLDLKDDDQNAREELLELCRRNCGDDKRELKFLKRFEKQTIDENAEDAIWWYTHNAGMNRSLNEVLVSGNIEKVYSYRYLIKIICRKLKILHPLYTRSIKDDILRLYRGQVMKLSDIARMKDHQNSLISFKSFLSTSCQEDIAKSFCTGRKKSGHEEVIFEIDIDLSNKYNAVFADIRDSSRYPGEEEVLFSIGSTFRINSVRKDKKGGFHRINLSLNPQDESIVNSYIEQAYPNEANASDLSVLFGKLLFDMGEYEFAIRYYQDRLDNLSNADNHHRPTYHNNIGACYYAIGNKVEALRNYKQAKRMCELAQNDRGLGACCHNIASYYYDQQDYDNASKYALDALTKRDQYQLEKAATLDLLGCIQMANHDTSAARDNLQTALNIRLKNLNHINPNHPDIGQSYHHLGRLDSKSSQYDNAHQNYQHARQIFRSNYPNHHQLVVDVTKRMQDIGKRLGGN